MITRAATDAYSWPKSEAQQQVGEVVPTNMSIRNNISYLNKANRPDVEFYDSWYNGNAVGGITVENNILTSALPQWPNNIVQDPLFVDPENNDFHLQSNSPAIGAGVEQGYSPDFDNYAIGTPCNIGAYDLPK